MSQQEQLVTLITNILFSGKNQIIAENEKLLTSMTENKLEELSVVLINILKAQQQKDDVKSFAVTHLRKHLSAFSQEKFKTRWGKISVNSQEYIKTSLFECLHKEKPGSVRNLISDAIGQVAGSLISVSQNNWPKFVDHVFLLLNDSSSENLISGLLILDNFFSFCPELFATKYEKLVAVFRKAFENQNNKVKCAGIKAFSSYIFSVDKKGNAQMQTLVIPLYQITFHLLINDKGNSEGLEAISDIVEMEPKFLKKTFSQLNELVQNVIKIKDLEGGIKKMGTQILLSFAQRFPAQFRQHKEKLAGLIEMLFYHMIEIDEEITDEWKVPPEGYSENVEQGDDFQTTTFGMNSVDRLISAVGQKEMLPLLSAAVQKMLTMHDWRYKYASIMALSQTGEYIEDATSIKGVAEMLLNFLGDSNPMLRFAACHAIGQISDDMQPHYQQHYGKDNFLKLAVLLKDPIPRVVAHAACALTNLVEGMNYSEIAMYMPQLIQALLQLSTTGISLVKQSALTTIASIAELAKIQFLPYFQKSTEVLFGIVKNHPGKQYKELKGLVIEALTSIAEAVGKDVFKPVAPALIEYLISVQDSQLEQVDPQKQYILGGWQRICVVFGKDIAPYLPRVLPNLFKVVQDIIESNIKTSNLQNILVDPKDDEKGEIKINTFETQEAEVAIAMLNVFVKEMGEFFVPYIQRTTKIIVTIVQSMINESVKEQALETLPLLVNLLKTTNVEIGITYTKNFLKILTEAALEEYDSDILIIELNSMKQIFELYDNKFLNAEELKGFSEQIIKVYMKSDERKHDTNGLTVDEDLEDEEKQLLNDEVLMEQEVQVAVSELIGQLFKTHKEMNAGLIEYITKNILPKVFSDGVSDLMHKFGIFLIDDMVEYLGYTLLSGIWNDFHTVFLKFCNHKSIAVRQAACYGLGIYAQNTPPEVFTPFIEKSLQVLVQAADHPKGSQSEKSHGHCRDNAISSFGKIIKYHGSSFDPKPCLTIWIKYLPLKNDHQQAVTQHNLLVDVLINNSSLLIHGQTPQSANTLLKILQVFGDIIQTKYTTPQITAKIKQCINQFKAMPLFVSNYDMFWSKLTQIQAVKLSMLVKEN